jgi:hypothetical protein
MRFRGWEKGLLFALVMAAAAIWSCGGGGGGGGGDTASPRVQLIFPPPVSLTDTAFITVRGTATDDSTITSLTVNGVAASTANGYAAWKAVIPLAEGSNAIVVAATDEPGNADTGAATARITYFPNLIYQPTGSAYDASDNRVLVLDGTKFKLFAVDLANGSHSVVSEASTHPGPMFSYPQGLVMDTVNARVFLGGYYMGVYNIFAVDLVTGARTIISGYGVGSGPDLSQPRDLALDPAGGSLLVTDVGSLALYSVDIASGARTVVSSASRGTGETFQRPTAVVRTIGGTEAIVADSGSYSLLLVNLSSGNRSVISSTTVGTGTYLAGDMYGLEADPANGRVFVTSTGGLPKPFLYVAPNVMAVDLSTGDRTVVSNKGNGSGRTFTCPVTVDYDAANDRLLVVDGKMDALMEIDALTGNRTVVSGCTMGAGPSFDNLRGFAVDPVRGYALVTQGDDPTSTVDDVWKVDLATGDRTVLSGATEGSGAYNPTLPGAVGIDPLTGDGLVEDLGQDVLFRVGIADGARAILSGSGVGTGPLLRGIEGIAIPAQGGTAYLVDSFYNTVYAVNLASGARTTITGPAVGSGPVFSQPSDIDLDEANGRVIVTDEALDSIFSVNLADGARTVISSRTRYSGRIIYNPQLARLDDATGMIVVSEPNTYSLVEVDPATAAGTLISDSTRGYGPVFGDMISLDVAEEVAYVLQTSFQKLTAIIAVDPQTGDRVIITK